MYIIYGDILFFINWYMDLLIFYLASLVLNIHIKLSRLLFGAAVASLLYCFIVFVPNLQILPMVIYSLLIPVIPIIYLFQPITIKQFIKVLLICDLVAFVIGGATFSIAYMIGVENSSGFIKMALIIIVATMISGIMTLSFSTIRKLFIFPCFEYQLKVTYNNKEADIKSIVDTGNCLYTPIGHKAVIVATKESVSKLLTEEQKQIIDYCERGDFLDVLEEASKKKLQFIPFSSIGCKQGVLVGIEALSITIYRNGFNKTFHQCVVAISPREVFKDNIYHALLHPDYIIS